MESMEVEEKNIQEILCYFNQKPEKLYFEM